ncbi:MAG: hypothetical protein AB1442_02790 [Nitrospirota bacterium]
MELLRKRHAKIFNRIVAYRGRNLPWDRLLPGEKKELLNKTGWDLTPDAFIEYSRLSGKYKKVKNTNPVEATLWNTDAVFERMVESF